MSLCQEMASKNTITIILSLFLVFNLLFFSLISASCENCQETILKPKPKPADPFSQVTCPRDLLKFRVCGKVLHEPANIASGSLSAVGCCSFFEGLNNLEATICICDAFKANIFGSDIDFPICLDMILTLCRMSMPPDFKCHA